MGNCLKDPWMPIGAQQACSPLYGQIHESASCAPLEPANRGQVSGFGSLLPPMYTPDVHPICPPPLYGGMPYPAVEGGPRQDEDEQAAIDLLLGLASDGEGGNTTILF